MLRTISALTRVVLALLFVAALHAPSSWAAAPAYLAPITQTSEPFIGVTYYQIVQSLNDPTPYILPRELAIHIVEIDPTAPGISFLGTPGNGATSNEYTRQTTGQFVSSNGLAVGINGDFYTTNTGITANVNGLGMSNGVVVSPPAAGDDRDNSLVVTQSNVASIISDPFVPTDAWNAVSGNQLLLRDGVNVSPTGSYTTTLNPHTTVGVDSDTGNVFFMVVDGRQANYSEGMRTDRMADLLLEFGVDDAINLDGGGSSTLVFADGAGGAARAVNSPSDGSSTSSPGGMRSVANHFGVYATPNPAYIPLADPPRPAPADAEPVLPLLTVLDGFDGGEGRFNLAPNASGSTNGITAASTADYTTDEAHLGPGSQKITLVRNANATSRVRHLSGGGSPGNNRVNDNGTLLSMGDQGHVGMFLKTNDPGVKVYLGVDDGVSTASTGLERSTAQEVIADGEWHLYEWDLDNAALWSNFSGGNGLIGGPNAYLDSVMFESDASTAGQTLTLYMDTVAYNPAGDLQSLIQIPEPSAMILTTVLVAAAGATSRTR